MPAFTRGKPLLTTPLLLSLYTPFVHTISNGVYNVEHCGGPATGAVYIRRYADAGVPKQ
jgi:hypothetical protein